MRKYYIFGASFEGVEAEYALRNDIFIEGFVDNFAEGTTGSKQYKIHRLSETIDDKDSYFIIATKEKRYHEIKKQLIGEGRKEFEDFIYWKCFNKKIAFLYGNCHMSVIREMLLSSSEFSKQYSVYPMTLVQEMDTPVDIEVLNNCDLFIIQNIRDENRFGYEYCTSYLTKQISNEKITIIVPNLYGMGLIFFHNMKRE